MRPVIASIDRVGAFAVPRADLEHGEQGARLCVDLAVVPDAPFQHLVGIDVDLFDAARIDAMQGQPVERLLDELDVRGRKLSGAADSDEARIVLWPRPDDGDDVVHGVILSVCLAEAV